MQGLYWVSDYDLSCSKGQHLLVLLLLAVPGLTFFSIGVPLGSWLFLRRHMSRLNDAGFSGAFGFVYEDYKRQHYYWESVILARWGGRL